MTGSTSSAGDVLLAGLDDNLVLSLDAAKLLPGRKPGKRMNARVMLRWVIAGVRGHRLRTLRIGQRHVVRIADLREQSACDRSRVESARTESAVAAQRGRGGKVACTTRRVGEESGR